MKLWVKILIAGAVVFVLAMAYIYFFIYNKPHTDYEKAKPDYVLTAAELYLSYIENQTEADNNYNGKVVMINGDFDLVEDVEDLIIINFSFADGMFGQEGVRCTMLENHAEKARELTPGQSVVIKGLVTGFSGSDVIMEHCSIQ